ncbi:MAG: Mrp/NBP35 family ATP-binding protein [Spirochaetia bacterium]|nr:Mrp/NBP35 family ATP-binding protein [Spirochaetia bacterium]
MEFPDASKIKEILSGVHYSDAKTNIVEDGLVKDIKQDGDKTIIVVEAAGERAEMLALEAHIKTALSKANVSVEKIKVQFNQIEGAPPISPQVGVRRLDKIKHIIAVGSGKGGVGKSTATMNIAATLVKMGYKAGILDGDIYGPSIGRMAGYESTVPVKIENEKIIPVKKHGIKMISFSFLIEANRAVVWRGPMLGKAIEQFLFDIEWGDLDYLLIDLPPGTGDVQLSLVQLIDLDGVVIITTPQGVALQDARRAIDMFDQVKVKILGIVENMSEFICPHCGKGTHIFSSEGGQNIAKGLEIDFLGEIPLSKTVMDSGEKGFPITAVDAAHGEPGSDTLKVLKAYENIVKQIIKKVDTK